MTINYSTKTITDSQITTDAAMVFAIKKNLSNTAAALNSLHANIFSRHLSQSEPKLGQLLNVTLPDKNKGYFRRYLLAQLSNTSDSSTTLTTLQFTKAVRQFAPKVLVSEIKDLTIFIDDLKIKDCPDSSAAISKVIAIEFDRAAYKYTTTLSNKQAKASKLKRIIIANTSAKQAKALRSGFSEGAAIASGINFARELGNLPGNHCTPTHLADFATSLAAEHKNLTVKVLGLKAMERLKMGSLLSVAKGSAEEPKFIIFEYKGKASKQPHVLVGKGITFDTGGISLKPGPGMDEMKFDMCGAASVFGTIKTLAEMNAKAHVIGVIAAAENMPSSVATKPGDVVTSMSGKTIEILNTDAEGRLVLCDALTYVERYKPKAVIDVATLTGACVIALGSHASGLYSNDQGLADRLLSAGESTGDRAWQMPLWDEYHESLKSNFADIANIGGREAGSVTAACFLAKFTKSYPWAHMDIAGSAWKSGGAKGATGRPVELLVKFLIDNA